MGKTPDFSSILPCYNEELIIEQSVEKILTLFSLSRLTYEIIFVDDKSTDGTLKVLKKICKKNSHCHFITHLKNCGRGGSVVDGINKALGLVVGYIDIDLEVSPVYIPEMVQKILSSNIDIVIGKRIYRTSFVTFFREVLSRGYIWLATILVGTGGLDTETGYKFFNRSKILPIIKHTQHRGWFWDTEIMVFAKRAGLLIMEAPVLFLRRTDKHSSVKVFRVVIDYLISLWRLKNKLKIEVIS